MKTGKKRKEDTLYTDESLKVYYEYNNFSLINL
jgi:hypothetical protein